MSTRLHLDWFSSLFRSIRRRDRYAASTSRMSTITEMRVHIDCPGCENKVRKALQRMRGVDEVEIDVAMQKVTVTGWADQKKILRRVRGTGRRAELWQFPYNPELRTQTHHHQQQNHQHSDGSAAVLSQFGQPQPSSSYNYYKHGGDQYQGYTYYNCSATNNSSVAGRRAGDAFSDENPNGCSIM